MKYRIAMWAIGGFFVAGFWVLFAMVTFPSTSERMREMWTFICLTCPIAILGRHHAISLYETLAANTFTYALAGLIVESLRERTHHTRNSNSMRSLS